MSSPRWRRYQTEVRDFLRTLGLDAENDFEVVGARARHNADVWVTFRQYGLDHRWIVECKYWKRRIPKEKVLALQSIVQDVGADRGLLMSERGFQAGAIRAAEKTNIVLTSLAELKAAAQNYIKQSAVTKLHTRLARVEKELQVARDRLQERDGPPPYPGAIWIPDNEYLAHLGALSMVDRAVKHAVRDEFPVVSGPDESGTRPRVARNLGELVDQAEATMARAESYARSLGNRPSST